MINNVADLKNRTLVESNTLKQFILASGSGLRKPDRDDILIHDYQIANSVTLNSLLSNYIVNLQYAWGLLDSPVYGTRDSYFDMRSKLEESDVRQLNDNTKLILEVDDGVGSFKSRKLDYDVVDIPYDPGTIGFINLDAVWYGIVRKPDTSDSKKEYDQINIAEGMNDFFTNPNPWGKNVNPFNSPLYLDNSDPSKSSIFPSGTHPNTFNEFLRLAKQRVNTAIENQLYKNKIEKDTSPVMFGNVIPKCKYIVCLSMGLYGLCPKYDTANKFIGMTLYDIGKLLPNLDGTYEFKFCGFHVIDNKLTLFVVFRRDGEEEYRYFYFNNESYDKLYGFRTVNTLVVDQLVVDPKDVFSKVDSIKQLDTVNVLMTNYGFWDIEPNQTRDITYSYTRASKTLTREETSEIDYNGHKDKVILPTVFPTTCFDYSGFTDEQKRYDCEQDKVVEYDKIWKKINDTYYKCFYVGDGDFLRPEDEEHPEHVDDKRNEDYPSYLAEIYGLSGKTHPFMGGTKYFAVYDQDADGTEPIQILAHMTDVQFKDLLFSMPGLVSALIKWLYYGQVTHPELCEWYLEQNHGRFCGTLNPLVTNKLFDNLSFKIGETAHSTELIKTSGKFSSIEKLVKSQNNSASTLYHYCDELNDLVNNTDIQAINDAGCNWLIQTPDSGKSSKETLLSRVLDEYAGYGSGASRVAGIYETDPDQRNAFIEHLCDAIIDAYPLLGYFREYIRQHLMNDYGTFPSNGDVTITPESFRQVIQNIQAYIKDKVMTALILGEYREYDNLGNALPENNERYPRIGPYIYQDKVFLSKPDIMDIMSTSNVKTEVISGVKSMPFFTDYNTYLDLLVQVEDNAKLDKLFIPTHNVEFLRESKMFDSSSRLLFKNGVGAAGVRKWDNVSGWLYPEEHQTKAELLKAFVRTQLYRPVYFKYDDYVHFTKDESKYRCITDKFYLNHDGIEHPLVFKDGKGPETEAPEVNKTQSGLDRKSGDNYIINDISYFKLTNFLEYYICYDWIKLIDMKFVFNDIEYYAVAVGESGSKVVNAIYFNEFQKDMEAACDQIEIVDNKFKLNGCEYAIEVVGGKPVITVDAATNVFGTPVVGEMDADGKEYKVEIVDDKFKIDGIRYTLQKQGGKYKRLKYAGVDDNKLTKLEVSIDGIAVFPKWNLELKFKKTGSAVDWNVIRVVKRFQSPVIDRLSSEWCIYDSFYTRENPSTHVIESNTKQIRESTGEEVGTFNWDMVYNTDRTFEWYLANEIQRMKDSYAMSVAALSNLGDGTLFSGMLKNTQCKINLVHETQGRDVVSKLVMTMDVNGETRSSVIGDLFDKNMSLYPGRVIRGSMDQDGLISESETGAQAFILKDIESNSKNSINSVWLDWSDWSGAYTILGGDVLESVVDESGNPKEERIGIGELDEDEETGELHVNWYPMAETFDLPEVLHLAPVFSEQDNGETDAEGNKLKYVSGFTVTDKENGTGQRIVNFVKTYNGNDGKFIHLTARGINGSIGRYVINYETLRIFKLEFREINALTFDFSTMYTFDQLRDNLLTNIKQYMMNQIVQCLLDYSGTASAGVDISPRGLDLYLDLFTDDMSFDNYMVALENMCSQQEQGKYQQVFKNNLHDIDDSNISDGRLYQYLRKKIQNTFQTTTEPKTPLTSIPLVDKPSFLVKRVSNVDKFTYECVFDLYLMQNKKLMEYLFDEDESSYGNKYMICNAIVKDIVCRVSFTPDFDKNYSGNKMRYYVTYTIVQDSGSQKHTVEYDQVVYNLNEKTKHKSIQKDTIQFSLSGFSSLTRADSIKSFGNKPEDGFTSETVSALLKETEVSKQIFNEALIRELFIKINNAVAAGTTKLVETEILVNSRESDSIWKLNAPLPSDADIQGRISEVNLGETMIYGDVYQVKERKNGAGATEEYLCQKDGGKTYDIRDIKYHRDNSTEVAASDPKFKMAFGQEVPGLDKTFLTNAFTLGKASNGGLNDVYLAFTEPGIASVRSGDFNIKNVVGKDAWTGLNLQVRYVKQYSEEEESDKSTELIVGNGLDEYGVFEVELPNGLPESEPYTTGSIPLTGLINGSYEDGQGNQVPYNNGWTGINGSFKIKFTDWQTDEPKGQLQSEGLTSCYTLTGIPAIDDCAHYVYENTPVECTSVVKEIIVKEIEGESQDVVKLKFRLKIKRQKYLLMYKPAVGSSYIQYNVLIENKAGTITAKNVIPLLDANNCRVGELDYGFTLIPQNVNTAKSYSELDWYPRTCYIEITPSTMSIKSGCIDVPVKLTVLPPGSSFQFPGDIYGRKYQVEHNIFLPILHVSEGIPNDKGKTWMDIASTVKTIRTTITSDQWKNLIYNTVTGGIDTVVPEVMREKVQKLVTRMLLKDDEYFKLLLTQFHSFMSLIYDELVQGLSVQDIRDLCRFDYSVRVSFPTHSGDWNDEDTGLFGFGYDTDPESQNPNYKQSKDSLDTYLYNQFFNDFSNYSVKSIPGFPKRDYLHILKNEVECFDRRFYRLDEDKPDIAYNNESSLDGVRVGIFNLIGETLNELYKRLNMVNDLDNDIIAQIFGGDYSDDVDLTYIVRFLNVIETTIYGNIVGVYVFDGYYNLFVKQVDRVMWYKFLANGDYASQLLENKRLVNGEYKYTLTFQWTDFPITTSTDSKQLFRFLNRDLSRVDTTTIKDSFSILCYNEENESLYGEDSSASDLWYVSNLTGYVYATKYEILDMAYEQTWDSLYVLFKDDNYLYRFDNAATLKDSKGQILLQKENATMKIETFHSVLITPKPLEFQNIYLDYKSNLLEDGTTDVDKVDTNLPKKWTLRLYGKWDDRIDIEEWIDCPGNLAMDFQRHNNIVFGDSLFDESQLRFQNISKNKDMVDILDINEMDGCYYGMFHDENQGSENGYAVFKCRPAKDGGVIQKLPYEIINPHMFRTADSLYSLYVITEIQDKEEDFEKPQLQEITVPDIDMYAHRKINIYEILQNYSRQPNSNFTIDNRKENDKLVIYDIIAGSFKLMDAKSYFFVLTNKGFFKVFYKTVLGQVSIDNMDDLNTALSETLKSYAIKKHMDKRHHGDQADYFDVISAKVNQYTENFSPFQLVPTEFTETQDIGVIPDSQVDNLDETTDHRVDSIQISTDIFAAGGMFAYTDTNPGIVTAAVSNPATTYDDDQVFPKSQRNPSLEGTEFYDFIYDQKGNTLMDLYAIPFIYIINSNNTYDLYINIPTTRTKYLNRIAGTLKENGTTQVLTGDTRTRRNFGDEAMANNLDESTTKLRIYIDKKYISIGNVELVEISGNSIPLQIYRDVPNNGLYDSIALESRWTGEVTEIDEPSKDINKVMLEFECYGTDSQSIHIQGKTLINRALDDRKYKFG